MEIVDKKRMRSTAPEVKPSEGTAPVPVAVVGTTTEAELIVGMLRSNNVRAAVSADDAGGQEPELQLQGVRVLVAAADAAEARRLLAAADDTA
jgi:Putative prokaryotic signal transducing protein